MSAPPGRGSSEQNVCATGERSGARVLHCVMSSKPLRILYAAGPGNVLGTYRHWRGGEDDPSQVAMTYSGQF